MKVEVDMEKISAEIAAAEEAARKRMAEREKDAGDRGAREAPTCVLAEEDKHICATHGNKSQQNSLSENGNKEGEDAETNKTDAAGDRRWPLFVAMFLCDLLNLPGFTFLLPCFCSFDSGKPKASEELEAHAGSEEGGVSEDKESVPEGAMEEGTSDSNTGSETTSAQTEDAPTHEPSEGPSKARAAHWLHQQGCRCVCWPHILHSIISVCQAYKECLDGLSPPPPPCFSWVWTSEADRRAPSMNKWKTQAHAGALQHILIHIPRTMSGSESYIWLHGERRKKKAVTRTKRCSVFYLTSSFVW